MSDSIADDILRSGYDRWLRLEEEKAAIGDDLKELFAELKAQGFTPKALRESFRRVRNADNADQQEHDAIVDLYVASLTRARPAPAHEKTLNNFGSPASYSEAKGRGDAHLVATVAAGMQTEVGRKALVTALDIMIEREEGELTDNQKSVLAGTPVQASSAAHEADESAAQDDVGATASSTNPHSPDDLLPVEADTAGGVAPPAPPATLSDPYDPGPIPAFLDRRQPKAREWEDA